MFDLELFAKYYFPSPDINNIITTTKITIIDIKGNQCYKSEPSII